MIRFFGRIIIGVSIFIVVSVVIIGLIIIDSPTEHRFRKIDYYTVRDLKLIRTSVDAFLKSSKHLPRDLKELKSQSILPNLPRDPFDEKVISYDVIDSVTYRLCADFLSNSFDFDVYISSNRSENYDWRHTDGEYCFTFEVDQKPGEKK